MLHPWRFLALAGVGACYIAALHTLHGVVFVILRDEPDAVYRAIRKRHGRWGLSLSLAACPHHVLMTLVAAVAWCARVDSAAHAGTTPLALAVPWTLSLAHLLWESLHMCAARRRCGHPGPAGQVCGVPLAYAVHHCILLGLHVLWWLRPPLMAYAPAVWSTHAGVAPLTLMRLREAANVPEVGPLALFTGLLMVMTRVGVLGAAACAAWSAVDASFAPAGLHAALLIALWAVQLTHLARVSVAACRAWRP